MLNIRKLSICICFIIIIGLVIGFFIYTNKNIQEKDIKNEYLPEEEISCDQMRQTMVSLYFKDDKGLIPEVRLIDAKKLLNNPYETILNLLIVGPKNEKLMKTIPEGTKINSVKREGDILVIDLTSEFINNHIGGEKEEKITIDSIIYSLTELTEINKIKILIDGKENKSFNDEKIIFNKLFFRE